MGIWNEQTILLAKSLETNHNLAILKLSCSINKNGAASLSLMLDRNYTLNTLDLFLRRMENEKCALDIAAALKSNMVLKHYYLDFANRENVLLLREIYHDMEQHKALAKELEWSTNATSGCPFLRVAQAILGNCGHRIVSETIDGCE